MDESTRHRGKSSHPQHHYSPASVDGKDSASLAKQVSRAYTESYWRGKKQLNTDAELLGYLPDQPRDDIWSGSPLDENFWRANANFVISRQATGLTREQRSVIDGTAPTDPPPVEGNPPARFFESTKSRHKFGR